MPGWRSYDVTVTVFSTPSAEVPDKASRGQQELAALVKNEIARWTPIIKAANIKGE